MDKTTDYKLEKWFEKNFEVENYRDYQSMMEITKGEIYETIHSFLIDNNLIEKCTKKRKCLNCYYYVVEGNRTGYCVKRDKDVFNNESCKDFKKDIVIELEID